MLPTVITKVVNKVFGYLFFDIAIKLMPFFILPYFSHILPMAEFKSVSLFMVLLSFLLTLLPLGVSTKVLLKLTEKRQSKLFIPSALFVPFFAAVCLLLSSVYVADIITLKVIEVCYLVLIAFNLTIGQVLAVRFQAEQKSHLYGSIMLLLQASFYIPLLYIVSLSNSLSETSLIFNICIVLQIVLISAVIFLEKKSYNSKFSFSMAETKVYALFIGGILIHILVNSTRFIYDRLFMASTPDDAGFVYYNIAMQVAMILSVLLVSANRFWTAFYFSNKDNITKKHYITCIAILIVAAIFVYIFGVLYINLFYPPDYTAALNLVPLLLMSYVFQGLYLTFSVQLYARENYKAINISSMLSLILSITIMAPLYDKFGSSGVAISVLISWLSLFSLSVLFSLKGKLKC
jgi:O-antigen/teichoic acid export membrane protein